MRPQIRRRLPAAPRRTTDARSARGIGIGGLLAGLILAGLAGCTPTESPERSGPEMLGELPAGIAEELPDDVILCHRESTETPAKYQLWIFRSPAGALREIPSAKGAAGPAKPRKAEDTERHDLPASILVRILAAKVPRLEVGTPRADVCRYSHWTAGDAEYQVRQVVTDRGWFATVEQFRP